MSSRKELANAIRILSIDAIQKAQSGHPGTPMGMADIAEVLWRDFLKHNAKNPLWVDRDRFILSNGHGSILIYCLLHLTGYDLSIEEIKNFRQLNSKTPGHPEVKHTPGIETTTGPLGQGIANAVGMAIAEKTLAAQFNRSGFNIVDHFTYVFLGDGCIMEGISHEACSLAGTLNLGKLIAFYDSNSISIDGNVEEWLKDDTAKRFEAYNWHVIRDIDGHDADEIHHAIEKARAITNKPSLIICKTIIGFGSPNKSGKKDAHGAPLGDLEINLTRESLGWHYPPFFIPPEIYAQWDSKKKGQKRENEWNRKFSIYSEKFPTEALEFTRRMKGELPIDFEKKTKNFIVNLQMNPKNISGRQASKNFIETFGMLLPELLGGSADLSSSNFSMWSGSLSINKNISGNYIHYGVREFGMIAIANGISLHGGFLPYTSTFLVFMDYARNAVRMAAIMKQHHIMIYTHDSIGIGEDGPTHQPIEQLASLRLTPNMSTWRPCDQVESAAAWKFAIERKKGPTSLILSRQNLVQQDRTKIQLDSIFRGGYILKDCIGQPELIFIATGSEVTLAVAAWNILSFEGIKTRVVSMPSTDTYDQQSNSYKESVLPQTVEIRIAIEAGIKDYWYKYVGLSGAIIGMTTFGKSAPAGQLFEKFDLTVNNLIFKAKDLLKR